MYSEASSTFARRAQGSPGLRSVMFLVAIRGVRALHLCREFGNVCGSPAIVTRYAQGIMARQLWLLRHAEAEPHGSRQDAERRLTERGERSRGGRSRDRGGWECAFEAILYSPKVRARADGRARRRWRGRTISERCWRPTRRSPAAFDGRAGARCVRRHRRRRAGCCSSGTSPTSRVSSRDAHRRPSGRQEGGPRGRAARWRGTGGSCCPPERPDASLAA